MIKKLLFASHNDGKIKEISDMLSPLQIEVISTKDLNLPDVEETGTTFEENALLKACAFAKTSNLPCLADDSGLCVNALDGKPGVYSARYAPNRDFVKGMTMLIDDIKKTKLQDWSAYFICVLALCLPDGSTQIFEGRVDGKITPTPKGTGFGYDPIFIPSCYEKTFGEMSKEEKNAISHRGRALTKFVESLKN